MSDTDENITHVFDQTNGVLDGSEGEPGGTAAEDRRPGTDDGDRAALAADDAATGGGTGDRADPSRTEAAGGEHAFAVDSSGTATDVDDATAGTAAGGAHAATTADTVPTADRDADVRPDATDRSSRATGSPTAAGDDDSVGHVFDQTNGVAEGLEGESSGTADGDEASAADRGGQNEPNPVGQQDAWRDDHYGADDRRDPNP